MHRDMIKKSHELREKLLTQSKDKKVIENNYTIMTTERFGEFVKDIEKNIKKNVLIVTSANSSEIVAVIAINKMMIDNIFE